MAGKKYWKISLVDMVITCENIGFITRGLWPLVINPIFSLVITITTRDIFQYFFPAIYYYLITNYLIRFLPFWNRPQDDRASEGTDHLWSNGFSFSIACKRLNQQNAAHW